MIQDAPQARFGGVTPPAVDALLERATSYYYSDATRAEQLLLQARVLGPHCLSVHFSLYKFYFYKQKLAQAEAVVLDALQLAATLGNFSNAWQQLKPTDATWSDTDHPAHFYLFSLKALAFIRLRLGQRTDSMALLDKLQELDPQDQVGSSVIQALATGSV